MMLAYPVNNHHVLSCEANSVVFVFTSLDIQSAGLLPITEDLQR